jgi:hypothetical protein
MAASDGPRASFESDGQPPTVLLPLGQGSAGPVYGRLA